MNNFYFHTPTRIYFGKDEELKVGKIIAEYKPKKVLIHYGGGSVKKSGLLDRIKKCLDDENINYVELGGVKPNPELGMVRMGIKMCLSERVDFILAVGGGSVMDSAKDIANGVANPDVNVWDFCLRKAAPVRTLRKGAVLTIAAAGSEMSDSCVITNELTGEKRGYGSQCNRFDFAIMNPLLTFTVSKYQTACGIVDIGMHTMERYFSVGENTDLTDAVAEAIMRTSIDSGLKCYENPEDYDARANMMWCSSLSHNNLTGLGRSCVMTVHQLEHEVSGLYPEIAHGAGLAALFCSWARYVKKEAGERLGKWARAVWDTDDIDEALHKQEEFYKKIGMPTNLKELGIKESDLEHMARECSRNRGRTLAGYKVLDHDMMYDIYKMAYDA